MNTPPISPIIWPNYHRLINSAFPPIDLFEDIADPADWELLARAESRTNPRISATIGQLDKIPVDRRVSGPGSSYVTAPFVHASTDRPGRFHDGNFGALYIGDSYETALFEVLPHTEKFCLSTRETPGWIADLREVIGNVNHRFHDIRGKGFEELLRESNYEASQNFARNVIAENGNGIIYPSVRNPGGECIAAFYPNVVSIPIQGKHIGYHWNGEKIDYIRDYSEGNKIYEINP